MNSRIAILGGLGHVGLPLGLVLADVGFPVSLVDTSRERLQTARSGKMPFLEAGADALLTKHRGERLSIYDGAEAISLVAVREASVLIVTIGTPIDEYENPRYDAIPRALRAYGSTLDGKLIVLRSTVSPGGTAALARELKKEGIRAHIAFCPERILQGHAIEELRSLPQIISGLTEEAEYRAASLFSKLGVPLVRASVAEAELAKLFLNSWRYIAFAAPNEFMRLATELGVDYKNVERAMKEGYSRAAALPSPGFAAGPCLLKDTMQLVAASPHGFPLGMAARMVNERTPETVVRQLVALHGPIDGATIGILGMAFKADNDDTRDSLSFQLKKRLEFAGARVLCSDEHAPKQYQPVGLAGEWWRTKEEIMAECSGIVVGVNHRAYHGLKIPDGKVCVDLWGVTR